MTASAGTGLADASPRPLPVDDGDRRRVRAAQPNAAIGGLIWTLIRTDFKARYHGTLSGFVWALLKPTAMFVVLVAVFSFVFRSEPNYKLNLILGLFLWDFFADATKTGMTSLAAKGFLVTKARFPRWIVVVTSIANAFLTLLVFVAVVTTYLTVTDHAPSIARLDGVRLLCPCPGNDRDRHFARVERAVPAVPRFESNLGHGDSGGLLHRTDRLPRWRHPRTLPLLFVSLAANTDHRVLAIGSDCRHLADGIRAPVSGGHDRRHSGSRRGAVPTLRAARGGVRVGPMAQRAASKWIRSRRASTIPSVRRETVREHLFGVLEPRNFERMTVLDNISFELREGETLGIMGRNGCGKSTLLKILCGIYMPDEGEVRVNAGIDADSGAGRRMESGARRDRQHLPDWRRHGALAAGGGIAASARSLRSQKSSDSRDLKLKHYSSGMASRLAYAMAFHAVRDVLVLDEIFAVGDAGFRAKCEQTIPTTSRGRARGHRGEPRSASDNDLLRPRDSPRPRQRRMRWKRV